VQWLFGWWERIDEWITENRPGGLPAPAVVAAPLSPSPSPEAGPAQPD
jgi:hypothetical protein